MYDLFFGSITRFCKMQKKGVISIINISLLNKYNIYGLTITQNNENIYTINNKAGETFIAEFKHDNCINLLHWNYRHGHGKTHKQGSFSSIPDVLKNIYSHGNRFFVQNKRNRLDYLFSTIERKHNG
jgi:hypothetical protein